MFCVIGKLDFIGQPLSALGHFCFKLRLLGLCLFQHGVEILLTDTPCNHILIKPHDHFIQNLNPFLVPCKGAFHCFPLFPLLGFTGIGQAVSNRFPVHQGSSGTFPDFPQHMAVKGVIVNPVLGAVVLSKGIVGLAGINLLGMFCVCVEEQYRDIQRYQMETWRAFLRRVQNVIEYLRDGSTVQHKKGAFL